MSGRDAGPASASRPAARKTKPARRRWTALVFYGVIGLICLALGGLTFLLVLSPTEAIRQRLVAQVKAATGRDLSMASADLRLFPSPGLELVDAVLGPPPGRGGGPAFTARRVGMHISLTSLVAGRIEPELIRLVAPTVELAIDARGRHSWDFGSIDRPPLVRLAQLAPPGSPGRFSPPAMTPGGEGRPVARQAAIRLPLRLPAIEIQGGRLLFRDDRLGRRGEATGINLRLASVSRGQPLSLTGDFRSAGERVEISASGLLNRDGFRDGKLALTTRLGSVRYEGSMQLADVQRLAANGRIEIASQSLGDAMRWLTGGQSIPGLGRMVSLASRVDFAPGSLTLDGLDLKLDAMEARGVTKVEIGGFRPKITADLEIARLDLDQVADRRAKRSDFREPKAVAKSAARRPDAIGALIEQDRGDDGPEPGVPVSKRAREPRDWSDQPIAFSTLDFVDVDARLRVGALRWQRVPVEAGRALVTLSDGVLKVALDDARIHGGQGKGVVTVSSAGHVAIDATLDGVDVLTLLSEAGRFDAIEGRGRVRLDVAGHGPTEREIIDTMSGTASLLVQPGAIVGWSISDITNRARRLQLPPLDRDWSAKTPFDSLSATFKIASGVGRSSGLELAASPIGIVGDGTIDLRNRSFDLILSPRLAGGGETQAAAKRLAALVPLKLRGPWDRPKLSADITKALKSPEKALEAAREVGKTIKDEDIDKAARKLLGDSPEAQKGADRAKKLLRRFLER